MCVPIKLDPSMKAREIASSLRDLLQKGVSPDECLMEIERSLRLKEYDIETRHKMCDAVGGYITPLLCAFGADPELCTKCVSSICLDRNLWLFLKKGASPTSCLEKLLGCSVKKRENLRLFVHYGVEPNELIRKFMRSGVTISCSGSISLLLRFGGDPSLLMGVMTGDAIAENLNMLLKFGASPNECAKRMKRSDVLRLSRVLISYGGDVGGLPD